MAHIGLGGYTAHIRGYYRLLAHPTSFLGQWHPIGLIRWGEAMRLSKASSARFTRFGELQKLGHKPVIRTASPQRIGPFDVPTSRGGLVGEDKGMGGVFQFDSRPLKTPKTAFRAWQVNGPI